MTHSVLLTCWSCCLYSSRWLFFMCLSLAFALQNVMKHWKHCRFSCWSESTTECQIYYVLLLLGSRFKRYDRCITHRNEPREPEVHSEWWVCMVLPAFPGEPRVVDPASPVPSRSPLCLRSPSPWCDVRCSSWSQFKTKKDTKQSLITTWNKH